MKKIGAVHLIKFYGDEGRKYLEVPRIKYLVLLKCGTKYQKIGPDTNLIFINTFQRSTARKKFKIEVSKCTHWYFTITIKELKNITKSSMRRHCGAIFALSDGVFAFSSYMCT